MPVIFASEHLAREIALSNTLFDVAETSNATTICFISLSLLSVFTFFVDNKTTFLLTVDKLVNRGIIILILLLFPKVGHDSLKLFWLIPFLC